MIRSYELYSAYRQIKNTKVDHEDINYKVVVAGSTGQLDVKENIDMNVAVSKQ